MSVDLAALRSEVKAGQQALRESYALTNDALDLLRTRCRQVDDVLTRLWAGLDFPATLTLAAVGGYGRGELYPASDIDLLILLPHEPDAALQERLERLVGHFWDIGLEIGHSVRTVQECLDEAAGDISVQTALVEAGLELVDSYVSMTELSEYAKGIPEEMQQARLYPQLPPEGKSAFCFYPMSKRRNVGANWYELDYDRRKELMYEHGASGRRFAGRVTQLITGSTGLDEYEWGVTLFAAAAAARATA